MTRVPESLKPLLQIHPENGLGAEPVVIWKARKYIAELSDEALSLTKVARLVKIHPNYFSEKFKEVTGLNFVTYLARIRVAKAAELLKNRDLRVSEIAFAVGFQSLSQFNRVFKRLVGSAPTEFRLAARKDEVNGQAILEHGEGTISRRIQVNDRSLPLREEPQPSQRFVRKSA